MAKSSYISGNLFTLFKKYYVSLKCDARLKFLALREWSKDFTEVTMIVLKKKPIDKKCSNHPAIDQISQTGKVCSEDT
jgi:hypothetical protein